MKTSSDCPGEGKCHGPASWRDVCGDVDLVCDDPRCDAHDRLPDLEADRIAALEIVREIQRRYEDAKKDLREAEARIFQHKRGGAKMVARSRNANPR